MSQRCVFVGYDRVADVANRLERTRKNMAALLGLSYDEFKRRFAWENLHGEEAAPAGRSVIEDRRLADALLKDKLPTFERAIFVGNDVAGAFGCDARPFYEWSRLNDSSPLLVARVRHTSQRNWTTRTRWGQGRGPWAAEAQAFLRDLARRS